MEKRLAKAALFDGLASVAQALGNGPRIARAVENANGRALAHAPAVPAADVL